MVTSTEAEALFPAWRHHYLFSIFLSRLYFFFRHAFSYRKPRVRRRLGAKAVPLLAILLVAAWTTVLAVVLCLLVLPFLLGRGVFLLLHLPPQWTHDTASFSVGLTVLKVRACLQLVFARGKKGKEKVYWEKRLSFLWGAPFNHPSSFPFFACFSLSFLFFVWNFVGSLLTSIDR